jgi:hypothetical protein
MADGDHTKVTKAEYLTDNKFSAVNYLQAVERAFTALRDQAMCEINLPL